MLNVGLAKEAVKHKMVQDGLDPAVLDRPDEPASGGSSSSAKQVAIAAPSAKDDPKYKKYFKMLNVGLAKEAVKHKMVQDGLDPAVLDRPDKPAAKILLKDDPKYKKYFKMLSIGLSKDAVKHKMEQDGIDPGVLDRGDSPRRRSRSGSGS